jgi:hypothetical protein
LPQPYFQQLIIDMNPTTSQNLDDASHFLAAKYLHCTSSASSSPSPTYANAVHVTDCNIGFVFALEHLSSDTAPSTPSKDLTYTPSAPPNDDIVLVIHGHESNRITCQ